MRTGSHVSTTTRTRRSALALSLLVIGASLVVLPPARPAPTDQPPDPATLAPAAQAAPLGPGVWPMYGHDLANSRNAGAAGPSPSAARRLGPVWSFESTTGGLTGTPAVAEGRVVALSNNGVVYALDALTGNLQWRREVDLPRHYLNGTAAVDHGVVFVPVSAATGAWIVALSLSDGSIRWSTLLDPQQAHADLYSSPVVWRGTIYIGESGTNTENHLTSDRIRGAMVALDEASGRVRWRTYTVPPHRDGGAIWTSAAIDTATGRIYEGTGNAYHAPAFGTTDAVLSISSRSGRILRHVSTTAHDVLTDYDFGASPNLIRGPHGRPLVGALQKSRVYWAFDRRTLKPVWKARTTTTPTPRPPVEVEALASTAYDGSRIYGQSDNGQLFSISRAGRRVWITSPQGGQGYSPVAVANGVVYRVVSKGFLEARRAKDGRLLTRLPLGAKAWGGVSVAGGWVFVVTGTDTSQQGYVVGYRPR